MRVHQPFITLRLLIQAYLEERVILIAIADYVNTRELIFPRAIILVPKTEPKDVSAGLWNKFVKGSNMSRRTQCGIGHINRGERWRLAQSNRKLANTARDIDQEINHYTKRMLSWQTNTKQIMPI